MRTSETVELYKQGDSLYWESIEEFEEFSKELVRKVKEELSKHNNATLTTIAFEARSYSEYGENYPYETIELDFERDMTQEEMQKIKDREDKHIKQHYLARELRFRGLNENLAYDDTFFNACNAGFILFGGRK